MAVLRTVTSTSIAVALVVGFISCAGTGAKDGDTKEKSVESNEGACTESVVYGNATVDAFIKDSYDVCMTISKTKATFTKVNEILGHPEGPIGWMKVELAKDASKVTSGDVAVINDNLASTVAQLRADVDAVPDDLKSTLDKAKGLLSKAAALPEAAKSLGLKAPKALKSIKQSTSNLKSAVSEIPVLLGEVDQVILNLDKILSGS